MKKTNPFAAVLVVFAAVIAAMAIDVEMSTFMPNLTIPAGAGGCLNVDGGTLYYDCSNNRLGINAGTSPDVGLHVSDSAAGDGTLKLGDATNADAYIKSNDTIFFDLDSDASASGSQFIIRDSAGGYVFMIDETGAAGIGTNAGYLPTLGFKVTPPATQTIAAGNTITANGCGTIKRISATSAVTTDTTNTFTAPANANEGCAMDVVNVGSFAITLDNNANFFSAGGADVVLGSSDTVRVISSGGSGLWYQIGGTGNN